MTSGLFSFVVFTLNQITLPKRFLVLDPGINAFSIRVEDLDIFVDELLTQGGKLMEANSLEPEGPITPEPEIAAFLGTRVKTIHMKEPDDL